MRNIGRSLRDLGELAKLLGVCGPRVDGAASMPLPYIMPLRVRAGPSLAPAAPS